MFHSDLVVPKTDYAHQAYEVCKTQAWSRPETAQFLHAQAQALGHQGKTAEAAAKLAEAERLEMAFSPLSFPINPRLLPDRSGDRRHILIPKSPVNQTIFDLLHKRRHRHCHPQLPRRLQGNP